MFQKTVPPFCWRSLAPRRSSIDALKFWNCIRLGLYNWSAGSDYGRQPMISASILLVCWSLPRKYHNLHRWIPIYGPEFSQSLSSKDDSISLTYYRDYPPNISTLPSSTFNRYSMDPWRWSALPCRFACLICRIPPSEMRTLPTLVLWPKIINCPKCIYQFYRHPYY